MSPDDTLHLRTLRELRERVVMLGNMARRMHGTSQYNFRRGQWLAAVDELKRMEEADAQDRLKRQGTA